MAMILAQPRVAVRNGIEVRVPLPLRNTVQGGAHGVVKAKVGGRLMKFSMSDLAIQERHLVPNTYDMALNQEMSNNIQNVASNLIFEADGMKLMGTCNEGGIGALFRSHGEMGAWRMMAKAVEEAGYKLGEDMFFGVDGAADRYYKGNGIYELDGRNFSVDELMDYYERMITEFPIIFSEDLWASSADARRHWSEFTEKFGHRTYVVMDDIATTNARLVRPLIADGCGNMLLLKMNQVGTMTEGWRAAETAHREGLMTVSSHRSTAGVDLMEIEVALALSMMRRNMGRCLFAKCGGAKLIERAMRYAMAQQWVEDWESGVALSEPISPDVTIRMVKGYPAPLNTGDLTTGIRIILSSGREINAVVPAGTSTGETEAALVPVAQAVRNVNGLAKALGLEGMRIGDLPDLIEFDQMLLAAELKEAIRTGELEKGANMLDYQVAAEMKRTLGANGILPLSVAWNRLLAAAQGKPSWLTFREAGEQLTARGMTFDDAAYYDPIAGAVVAVPKGPSAHYVREGAIIMEQLNEQHCMELRVLDEVFIVEGRIVYDVELRIDPENPQNGEVPFIRVRKGSKTGLGKKYISRVEDEFKRGYDHKALNVFKEGTQIYVDWLDVKRRGDEFAGRHVVSIPVRYDDKSGKNILLIGRFDEDLPLEERLKLFKPWYDKLLRHVVSRGYSARDEALVSALKNAFVEIPLHELFERSTRANFERYVKEKLPPRNS